LTWRRQTTHPLLERRPVLARSISEPVPVPEQAVRQPEPTPADRFAGPAAIDHRLKIAAEVRPTDLTPRRGNPLGGAETVAADNLVALLPSQASATAPARLAAIVMTVASRVTVTHSQTFVRS
jgi:hypothetical protein